MLHLTGGRGCAQVHSGGCSGEAGTTLPVLHFLPPLPAAPAPLLSYPAPPGPLLLKLLLSLSAQAQQWGPATRGPASQGEVPGGLRDSCQWLLNCPCPPSPPKGFSYSGHRSTTWARAATCSPPGHSRSPIIPPPPVSRGFVIYKLRKMARLLKH